MTDQNGEDVSLERDWAATPPETEFPEQMPYTEWEHSSYAPGGDSERSCQSCHMPLAERVRVASRPRRLQPLDWFSRHLFVGANTTMLDTLNRYREELDVTATGFEEAIDRNRALLASAADIELLEAGIDDNELLVRVGVNNRSGHKLPTSFPSRRAWIHLVVCDPDGEIVFESGRPNSDGSIEGVDADSNLSRYEPHHDLITESGQVQVDEPVMGDTDGEVTYTLLRGARYLKDNRLTPQGFRKHDVPVDVKVSGLAMADENFDDGSDVVDYRVSVGRDDAYEVEIELNYQTVSFAFLRDLFLDEELPEVARFRDICEGDQDKGGAILMEDIARASFEVER